MNAGPPGSRSEATVVNFDTHNVTKACVCCGGNVVTTPARIALCAKCRDERGLRTVDDLDEVGAAFVEAERPRAIDGPWEADEEPNPTDFDKAEGIVNYTVDLINARGGAESTIAKVVGGDDNEETKAIAFRIAAAPEMFAACVWALSMMEGGRPEIDLVGLRAAIAKAKGEHTPIPEPK